MSIDPSIMETSGTGYHVSSILNNHNIEINPQSYLFRILREIECNGISCPGRSKLLAIDKAIEGLSGISDDDWIKDKLIEICKTTNSDLDSYEVNSNSAAEMIAFGLLRKTFPHIAQIKPGKVKTPDFKIGESLFVEVYCPQHAIYEKEKIQAQYDAQDGAVKIAVSHPLTGSDGMALKYPTNKIIDRVLNKKRNHDQAVSGKANMLWLDLMNGFDLESKKTMPVESANKGDLTFFGCFGVWHSFYGEKDSSQFPSDRSTLMFPSCTMYYSQKEQGLFRIRPNLSAALILTIDGLVLFQNPWCSIPLSRTQLEAITSTFRFRPEFSFFDKPEDDLLRYEVSSINNKINWMTTQAYASDRERVNEN